jgi:hypothetical protein
MPSSKGSADYGGTDSGDTAFIIICGTLVLLMALPGIVLFYGRWPPPSPFLLACGWPRDGGRTLGSDVAAAPGGGASRARRLVARVPFCAHASGVLNSSVFLLAGGLTGFKNCTSTCIQTFAVASLISVTWLVFGYSLAFGHNWDGTKNDFIGGANMFWFWGDGKGIPFFPACKIIICLPVCNFALSSELDRGRRAEACVCCIAST